MFKSGVVVLSFCLAMASAGYLAAPVAYHTPVAVAAPIAIKTAVPVATSYQNTFKISAAPVPVVVKAAPVIAAPAVHYAAAPVVYKSSLLAAPLPYAHYSYH